MRLDRIKLAKNIARIAQELGKCPDLFVQVNTGEEPQKSGVSPKELPAFADFCISELGLQVVGLMCIPPADENPAIHFGFLNHLASQAGLSSLSMGMSADFETAISFGATHIRVGSAIFGDRIPR